jgi:hypothetical protein
MTSINRSAKITALTRRADTPNGNVANDAKQDGASLESSARLAHLFLSPLARLFRLSPRLDELDGGLLIQDHAGWNRTGTIVEQTLKEEKLRLRAIEPATRMVVRSRGGSRRALADAAADIAVKAESYTPDAGRRTQLRNAFLIMGERMVISGTPFPELGLTDEQEFEFKSCVEQLLNRPGYRRRSADGGSRAVSFYVDPIEGLQRAIERDDVAEVLREAERISMHAFERVERCSAELDALRSRSSTADVTANAEMFARFYKLTLESKRFSLMDTCIERIFQFFGGQERFAMELAAQEGAESNTSLDPRLEEILDMLCEKFAAREKELRSAGLDE